jgi:hypothetical protein
VKRLLLCVMLLLPVNGYAMTCEKLHEHWLAYTRFMETGEGEAHLAVGYISYLQGVSDALAVGHLVSQLMDESAKLAESGTTKMLKMPDYTSGQKIQIVGKYLENHPKEWGKTAALCILSALKESAN